MDKEFYDLCYEAWLQGKNPDYVNVDSYDYMKSRGFYPDEITLKDVYPQPNQEQEEE